MEKITLFIDSATLREMLEGKELPPAVECILISKSTCRSLSDKINAIRERLDAHSDEEFELGNYEWHLNDFRKGAENYIQELYLSLNCLKIKHSDTVFVIEDKYSPYDGAVFDNMDDAYRKARASAEPDEYYSISERIKNTRHCPTRFDINPHGNIYSINTRDLEWTEELHHAFADVPHDYKVGDIIRYCDKYAVITDLKPYVKKERRVPLDDTDMSLFCMEFVNDEFHSCGGAFGHIHVPILKAEMAEPSEYQRIPKPLLMLRSVLIGEMRLSDFIEIYSNNMELYNCNSFKDKNI